jgi:hypothetical protein
MAAKWCPNKTHLFVGTKSRPSSLRSEGVARVSSKQPRREKRGIKPVGNKVATQRSDHEPHRIKGLAAIKRDSRKRGSAQDSNHNPNQDASNSRHVSLKSGLQRLEKHCRAHRKRPLAKRQFRLRASFDAETPMAVKRLSR